MKTPEFIHKGVPLRGVVRWVGTEPPPPQAGVRLPPQGRTDKMQSVTADAGVDVPARVFSPEVSGQNDGPSAPEIVSQVINAATDSNLETSTSAFEASAPQVTSESESSSPDAVVKPSDSRQVSHVSSVAPGTTVAVLQSSSGLGSVVSSPAGSSTSGPTAFSTSGPAGSSTSGPIASSTSGPAGSSVSGPAGFSTSGQVSSTISASTPSSHGPVASSSSPSSSSSSSPSSTSSSTQPSSSTSSSSTSPSAPSSSSIFSSSTPPSSSTSPSASPSSSTSSISPPSTSTPAPDADDSLSNTEYRQTRPGLAELKSSSLSSKNDVEALTSLYLLVEHLPVFRTPMQRQQQQLLPVALAAVEVTAAGARDCHKNLLQQRLWFRPLYIQANPRLLACDVTVTSLGFKKWRTLNEDLVRQGNAVVSLVPDSGAIEQLAAHTPTLFERWHRTVTLLFKGPPPDTALVRVDPSGLKEIPFLSPSYYKLYEKVKKAETCAQKRRLGVWIDYEGDTQSWFITRLWYRFRSYTRKSE